jgi:type I restriction enzyme R subunit
MTQDFYSDEEVGLKTASVYQHIYTNYYGNDESVYNQKAP